MTSRLEKIRRRARKTTKSARERLKSGAEKTHNTARKKAEDIEREDVKRALSQAGESLSVETGGQQKNRSGSTAERAEQAARMGPPIEASLDPVTSPHDIHMFASSGMGSERPDQDSGMEMVNTNLDEFAMMGSPVSDNDDEDDGWGNPLAVEDDPLEFEGLFGGDD